MLQWVPGPHVERWIEEAAGPGARVARIEALPPSSTRLHRVELVLRDRSARTLLLRRYHDRARLAHDPWYVPSHEALVLDLLGPTAVPAPRLHAVDLESRVCDAPALLEAWLPGLPARRPDDMARYLHRTAETLVAIHALTVPPRVALPAYAPYHDRQTLLGARGSTRPALWERVARVLEAERPRWRDTFIHRDYHPDNVLWDGAGVTGVVDWATAAWGPPGIDLARMRQNLALHHGRAAADGFVAAYVQVGGDPSSRAPYWDLLDAADLLPDLEGLVEAGGPGWRRFEDYVESVLAEC